MTKFFGLIILITSSLSCGDAILEFEQDKTFPKVKPISDFEQTTFIPALEQKISTEKNAIYAVSLLMAWQEIKREIDTSITEIESKTLKLMDRSESFENVLSPFEYITSVEVLDSMIKAKAYFKKSLPFTLPMTRHEDSLSFLGENVVAFGCYGSHESCEIAYYRSDNDFALRFLPKDEAHEILIIKTDFSSKITLLKEIEQLEKNIKKFTKRRNNKNDWKYYLNDDDEVRVPVMAFNIEANYESIEGTWFETKLNRYMVEEVYQRTAFMLNEKGAEVESEVFFHTESAEEEEMPQPKQLYYDKPFMILLKRKDNPHPYFAMFVTNSEQMLTNSRDFIGM